MKQFLIYGLLLFCIFFTCEKHLQAQQFQWVKGGGSAQPYDPWLENHPEGTYQICTDANGNVYALSFVAYYHVYADTFSEATDDDQMLITSYTCDGQMRWAKLITSTNGYCTPLGIVADSSGHIYVAGEMPDGNLTIGYDTVISTNSYQQLGIVQLDTSGHFNWIQYVGNNSFITYDSTFQRVTTAGLTLDNADNIHFVFYIPSNVVLTVGDTTRRGCYDMQYSPSGTLLSAKRLQLDSTLSLYSAVIDKQSNKLYACGWRYGRYFNELGGDSSYHAFIAEFDTARNQVWIDTLGDNTIGGDQGFGGIAPDGNGHLYLCGAADGFMIYRGDTIRPAPGTFGYIGFIMKTDTSGNMKWVKQTNASDANQFTGITLMPNNKIAAVGSFIGTASSGSITIHSDANNDPLFTVIDTGANLITLQRINGDAYINYGNVIASDKIGNLYIGGDVGDSIPDTLIPAYHSVGGNTDFFVLKYGVDCSCTAMPVAAYTTSGTSTVTATYTGTAASGIDSVVWNFGDGHTGTGLTATHVYSVYGTVDLCVTAYTGCGYDIHCGNITVNCSAPITPAFTYTAATGSTGGCGFTYTGTTAALDSIKWNFGDGQSATETSASTEVLHTYSVSETYTVCTTVFTTCGSNTYCHAVVINCTPVSAFTYSGTDPLNFTYTGTTTGLDSVVWNFGDGHTGSGTTATRAYSLSGTYSVCATVYATCGSNTSCLDIVVSCLPTSSFTYSGTDPVNFDFTGGGYGMDSVVWAFGDGNTAAGISPTHIYTASGTYTVCATAYAACGSTTSCNTVTIDCTPAPSFVITGFLTKEFTYTASTGPLLDSVTWSFGDGNTGAGTNTTYSYTATGTYTVCATAHTACGNATICQTIIINCLTAPIANFIDTGSDPHFFGYIGTLSGYDSLVWNFGDGTTLSGIGTAFSTTHTYTESGTYEACVTVYTSCGSDSACRDIVVHDVGVPIISISAIQVYPNPAGDELNVTGVVQNMSYRLLTVTGVSVENGMLHAGGNVVSMQQFAPGVYVLEMTDAEGGRSNVRVVKE